MEKSGGYDVIFLYGTNCSSLNQVSYMRDNLKDYLQLADVIIIPLIDYYSFDQAEYAINHIEKYNKEASVNLITIVDGEVEFSSYYELDELEMTKNQFLMAWNQCIKSKT